MSKGLKFSPLLLALMAGIVLLVYLYLPQATEQKQRRGGATPVVVHEVKLEEFEVVVEALGTAKANESVHLTAPVSELVQSIEFADGDRVVKGQLILRLNDREEKARLHELDINLQEAKRQLKRITNLAKTNAASEQLLDEQQANVKALKAQKEVLNAQLAELEVRAPFAGQLGIRQVSVGSLIRPGDLIATLDDVTIIKLDFSIAESHLPSISVGQLIRASSIAYPGEGFLGKINTINSRVDPITRTVQVRAHIDNQGLRLRPGMLLQINLQKQLLNTLVVPEGALIPIEDKQFVYVIEEGKATQKEVQVGLRQPGIAQISSGLSAGEQVVVKGALRLRQGATVKIQADSSEQG
jgi:membrane fusion protein (multidrug efflux system)